MMNDISDEIILMQHVIILRQRWDMLGLCISCCIFAALVCGGMGVYNLCSQRIVCGIIQIAIAVVDIVIAGINIKRFIDIRHEMKQWVVLRDLVVAAEETVEV